MENSENLRGVFDLCSPDSDGFILTNYLAAKLKSELKKEFNDTDLGEIQNAIDPQNKGRISFEEFCGACKGISGALQVDGALEYDDSASRSDPEDTYNEYDIEEEIGEMENFEAYGESSTSSPGRAGESTPEHFIRRGSMRKSHRRAHSLTIRSPHQPVAENDEAALSDYEDLSEKVDILQNHVSRLADEKNWQSLYESIKRENLLLTSRLHEMEEKLQDANDLNDDIKGNSTHKLEELRDKLNREHDLKYEVLLGKMKLVKSENKKLAEELSEAKQSYKEVKQSGERYQLKSEELSQKLLDTNEEYRRLSQCFTHQQQRHDSEEKKLKAELSDLESHLESSFHEKDQLEEQLLLSNPYSDRLRAHVDNLKTENDNLKSTNEELNNQLAQNITDARSLMNGDSIADEMSEATRDDVMDALRKQEQVNEQLRSYLDKIILSVIERDPSILEIRP